MEAPSNPFAAIVGYQTLDNVSYVDAGELSDPDTEREWRNGDWVIGSIFMNPDTKIGIAVVIDKGVIDRLRAFNVDDDGYKEAKRQYHDGLAEQSLVAAQILNGQLVIKLSDVIESFAMATAGNDPTVLDLAQSMEN